MHSILDREAASEQTFQWKDQRNGLRQIPRRMPIQVEHPEQGKIHVMMVDLSRKGMRLRSAHRLQCGDIMKVLPPDGVDLEPLMIRIVRAQLTGKAENSVFEYGVHLLEPSRTAGHLWFLHFCYGSRKDYPIPQV